MATAESLDKLIDTISRIEQRNAALEERNATLEEQGHVLARLADRLPRAEEDARNARADKAALEQEIRLGGAQKAAKRVNTLITVVPNVIALCCMMAWLAMFISSLAMVVPVGYTWLAWPPMAVFMLTVVISLRPAQKKFVRVLVLGMHPDQMIPQVLLNLGIVWIYTLVESVRPYPRAVMFSLAAANSAGMLGNCLFYWPFLRGLGGEAARLSQREKFKLTWAFMIEELGSARKARLALWTPPGPVMWYQMWEGTALATKCEWPYSTRYMVNQMLKVLLADSLWWTLLMPMAPIYYLYAGTAADFMPPPLFLSRNTLTSEELDEYMAAARTDVLGYACIGPLFGAVGALFCFRGRIHAWLIGLATSGDAGRAAGVAAMIGKLEPQAVLGMARRTFTGLPFELLSKVDLSSNADTGLNAKARRCRLGEVDAFLSHSWHDDADTKWRALSAWAAELAEAQGRSPMVWLVQST